MEAKTAADKKPEFTPLDSDKGQIRFTHDAPGINVKRKIPRDVANKMGKQVVDEVMGHCFPVEENNDGGE